MHTVLRPVEPAHVLGPLTAEHAESAIETHGTLSDAFLRNYTELAAFEYAMQFDAHDEFGGESPADSLGGAHTEYVRRLQNFVASHAVLVEYTTTLVSEWLDDEQAARYAEATADHDVAPVSAFLSELPARLVASGAASLVGSESPEHDVPAGHAGRWFLSRDRLTDWEGWSADARRALESFDESVLVSSVTEAYVETRASLHAHLFALVDQQLSTGDADELAASSADLYATSG